MTSDQLREIYSDMGYTQAAMADLLGVSLVTFKRFATDERPVPAYTARLVLALQFLQKHKLLDQLLAEFESEPAKTRAPRPLTAEVRLAKIVKTAKTIEARLLKEGKVAKRVDAHNLGRAIVQKKK